MKTQLNHFSAQGTIADFTHMPFRYDDEKTNAPAGEDKEDKAYICNKQCHKCQCLTKTSTL